MATTNDLATLVLAREPKEIPRCYAASLLRYFFWLIEYAAGRGIAISIFYIYYNIYKINNI